MMPSRRTQSTSEARYGRPASYRRNSADNESTGDHRSVQLCRPVREDLRVFEEAAGRHWRHSQGRRSDRRNRRPRIPEGTDSDRSHSRKITDSGDADAIESGNGQGRGRCGNRRGQETEAELIKTKANLAFRETQYQRIKHLFELKSIEERLVDEKDGTARPRGVVQSAAAAILTGKAQAAAAQARVAQAEAAVEDAKADVQVAEANVSRAAVFVDYTRIISPYSGVVTRRSYHVGDFIRAAEGGGTTPLLSVARTDVMRVVVQVPERDAPFTERGDSAVVELDAISGKKYHGKVARIANL